MFLKRIELSGFKSFMERTVLEFGPGIGVIVGPNGCGKSNVVEAVCWAMGEQGLRPLRAKCSEDLIFAGSSDLSPAQACEVTLVFDNQNGGAPPEFNQYSEIAITRRLIRTGESEYMINGTRCRLKDITEFFLGTGLGKQAYSIIEQGEVERILQAKPEEIRAMIEEAAGISKYRYRRDEATRKIQLTRENLTRLRDILAELERQLSSLSRQAKKAERYNNYKNEIKETEMEIFAFRGLSLKEAIQKLENELSAKKESVEQIKQSLMQKELFLEEKKAKLELLNGELSHEQEESYRLKSVLEQLDSESKSLSRQEEMERSAQEKRKQEALRLEAQIKSLQEEISAVTSQKESLEIELSSLHADMESVSRELEHRLEESRKQKILFNSFQDELRKLEQELARLSEKEKSLVWQETRMREELEQAQSRAKELEPVISGERQRSFDFNQTLHQLRKSLSELRQKMTEKQASYEKLKEMIAEKSGGLKEIQSRYQTVCVKLESLNEMLQKLEGVERGVRYIMEKKRTQPETNGIYGLVADFIETQPEYELAVEAILGERIQSVVVESHAQGLEAVNLLKNESAGRGTFIPLSLRSLETQAIPEHIRSSGAQPLQELVQVKKGFEPVVNYLLGQSVLVNDLDQAIELWKQNGFMGAFVTREGAVLDPYGVLSGGSKDQAGLLSKKRELRELEDEKQSLKQKLEDAESELNVFISQQNELERELEQLKSRSHHLELEVLNQEKDLQQATDDLNQNTKAQESLRARIQELSDQINRLSREQAELLRKKTEMSASIEKLNAENESLLREMERKDIETARLEEERIRLRAEQAALKEKILGIEETWLRLQRDMEEQISRREQLSAEILEGEKNLDEIKISQEKNKQEYQTLSQALQEQTQRLAEMAQMRNGIEQEMNQAQTQVKEMNSLIRAQEDELQQMSLDYEREKMELEHQKQLLNEIYQEDLDQVMESRKSSINLSEFQIEPRQERVNELRKLILRMGEVNPTALDEYKEVESRYSFLSNQEADLINALSNLESTIQRINQEYRKKFKSTFDEVNAIFQDLFPKLFGGGKAMLSLVDENNILESGIEIIAQPPGKKFQNLSLLSGGEKALTAIALIFSLYLNRPSPFCLLDEADSALDEINIDRFNQLLRRVAEKSQVLLVTHNKRTMELGDILYGVTMEKPGVSTVVSVKLEEKA